MPRGPRAEQKLAEAAGCSVTVARSSVGAMQMTLTQPSGKVRRFYAEALANNLARDQSRGIAATAAGARWGS